MEQNPVEMSALIKEYRAQALLSLKRMRTDVQGGCKVVKYKRAGDNEDPGSHDDGGRSCLVTF